MASVSVSTDPVPSSHPRRHAHHHRPRHHSSISSGSTGTDGPPLFHATPAAAPVAAPPLAPFTRSYTIPAPPPPSRSRSKLSGSGFGSFMSTSSSSSKASSPSPPSSTSSSSRRHSLPGVDSGNQDRGECPQWARVVAAARALSANVDATIFSISNTLADTQSPTTQSLLARSSSSPSPSPSAAATRLAATSRVLSRLIHDLRLEVDDDLVQLDRAIIDLVYHARKLVLSGTVPGVVPMATLLETLAACERGVASVASVAGELCVKLQDMCVGAMAQAAGQVDGVDVRQVFADMHISRAHFVSQLQVADATRLAPPSAQVPSELVNMVNLQAQIRDAALTLNRLDLAVKHAPALICQDMLPPRPGLPALAVVPATKGGLHRSASFSALFPLPSSSSSHTHRHRPGSILSTFSSMFSSSSAHSSRSRSRSPSGRSMSSSHRLSISSTVSSDSTFTSDGDRVQSPTHVDLPVIEPASDKKKKNKKHGRAQSLSPIREAPMGSVGAFGMWKRSMMSAMHRVLHPTASAAAGGASNKHAHGGS